MNILKIELGGYCRKNSDERVCHQLCNRALEDEIHFLCVYTVCKNIRRGYYHKENINKSLEQFQSVVRQKPPKVLLNFMHGLWKYQNSLLYKL